MQNMFKNVNKTITVLPNLQSNLPRVPLVTIYKALVRLHVDYQDILYDQTFNNSFHEKLPIIQYNAALAKRGTIRGSSKGQINSKDGGTGNFVSFEK